MEFGLDDVSSKIISNEITAANELETIHRYAEHNAEISLAVAHQLAAPLLLDFDGLPPAVKHGCIIRLVGEFVMASENLAALILAYELRDEPPSFFRSITKYKSSAKTLLHAIDLACTASQRLATSAFGLATMGKLYSLPSNAPTAPVTQ